MITCPANTFTFTELFQYPLRCSRWHRSYLDRWIGLTAHKLRSSNRHFCCPDAFKVAFVRGFSRSSSQLSAADRETPKAAFHKLDDQRWKAMSEGKCNGAAQLKISQWGFLKGLLFFRFKTQWSHSGKGSNKNIISLHLAVCSPKW